MTRKKSSVKNSSIHSPLATAPDNALLVPPSTPALVPDIEGAPSNVVSFKATFQPLRVEFQLWAHSAPELGTEYLSLYWNKVLIERKAFDKRIQLKDLYIMVPVRHLVEGEHALTYQVESYTGEVYGSRALTIYIDKTPPLLADDDRLQFADYIIREGVTEEYLTANNDKVTATVPPFLGAEVGDSVKWYWSDDPVGQHMVDMMVLTKEHIETLGTQSISKPIELVFHGDFIRQSQNGTRFARYEIQDRAGTAPQRALARSLQSDPSPPPRVLPPPFIKEATGSDYFSTLLPSNATRGITFVIPDSADIRPNETATIFWGEPGTLGGYSTSTPVAPGAHEYLIPRVHVPPHINNRAELYYQINKADVPASPSHYVTVRPIEGLPIVQCNKIQNGALNLRTLGGSATFTLDGWAFRHTSQFVNAWIDGVHRDNPSQGIKLPIATALPVLSEAGMMTLGSLAASELSKMALNYQFRVSVEVSFDGKVTWMKFPDAAAVLEDRAS